MIMLWASRSFINFVFNTKGVGVGADPFENFRKQRAGAFYTRMRDKADERRVARKGRDKDRDRDRDWERDRDKDKDRDRDRDSS